MRQSHVSVTAAITGVASPCDSASFNVTLDDGEGYPESPRRLMFGARLCADASSGMKSGLPYSAGVRAGAMMLQAILQLNRE